MLAFYGNHIGWGGSLRTSVNNMHALGTRPFNDKMWSFSAKTSASSNADAVVAFYCCACNETRRTEDACNPYFSTDPDFYKLCHHYKTAFVDGACLGNGQDGATAGIGIAIELLAAINGIRKLGGYEGPPVTKSREGRAKYTSRFQQKDAWVIASDSEHVVSGMTHWLPPSPWKIAFWRIGRKYNTIADGLAGIAARGRTLEEHQKAEIASSTLHLSDVSL
ncbi:hypothetical protein OG21DRAFT_1523663 [Imleria badia]|nr:hypothetical protein OG21DRAFT_1523663 [Imleria badia]